MKAILCLCGTLGTLLFLSGCETELPEGGPNTGDKLRRGLTGQGTLYIPSAAQDAPAYATPGR